MLKDPESELLLPQVTRAALKVFFANPILAYFSASYRVQRTAEPD